MKSAVFVVLLLNLFLVQFAFASKSPWSKYSDVKESIKFPKYLPKQREAVAKQVKYLFDVYVNRESKMSHYGKEVDPVPLVQSILENAQEMTDDAFHKEMYRIFAGLRDFHTNYYFPRPYACHTAVWPIAMTLVDSSDHFKAPKVVVKALSSYKAVLDAAPQVSRFVSPGDVILSYNNKTFVQLYEEYKHLAGGSNQFGGYYSVLNYFMIRYGSQHWLPEETEAEYVIQKKDGRSFRIRAPIMSYTNFECLEGRESGDGARTMDFTFKNQKEQIDEVKRPLMLMQHPYWDEMKDAFQANLEYSATNTIESSISWSIYNNVGIIRLDSFVPKNLTYPQAISLIRDLLVNELRDTDALVFDVRGNGGGYIPYAESLPQLFVNNYKPHGGRLLVSNINKILLQTPAFANSEWQRAIVEADEGDTYTRPIPFVNEQEANDLGMVYYKPVGVLNNARCYSACDLFSAVMQDSGAATIFGEDPQTGAGGANVVEHKSFFVQTLPYIFRPLPGGQDLRVAWRQSVRVGNNQGKLIEDDGVSPDYVIRPRPEDFYPNRLRFTQLDRITEHLRMIGIKSGKKFVSFEIDTEEPMEAEIGAPIDIIGRSSGINRLELYRDNQLSGFLAVPLDQVPYNFHLRSIKTVTAPSIDRVTINGFYGVTQVLRTYRTVRFIPARKDFLRIEPGTSFNYSFSEYPFTALYNLRTADANGWSLFPQDKLVLGNGVQYVDNVTSKLSFFISSSTQASTVLKLKGFYATELKYDFFSVSVKVPSMKLPIDLLRVSGIGNIYEEFDLSEFSWYESFELYLEFTSDGAKTDVGVTITELALVAY